MAAKKDENSDSPNEQLFCGLIMPISAIDAYTAEHWSDVKEIIYEAINSIEQPRFNIKLVSDADDVGLIHKRIVQNIYDAHVVICDVSGKNANVMFELGMRLAFDKPTIIVKDDKTDYSFDTGVIEHVPYPRDLRFSRIVNFKTTLAAKVLATYTAAKSSEYPTFLKSFGDFRIAQLPESITPADKVVVEMIADLQLEVSRLSRILQNSPSTNPTGQHSTPGDRIRSTILKLMTQEVGTIFSRPLSDPIYEMIALLSDIHPSESGSPAFRRTVDKALLAQGYSPNPQDP